MLINIRGAFGAGKSTIARAALGEPNLGLNHNRITLAEVGILSPRKNNPNHVVMKSVKATLGHFGRLAVLGTYRPNNPCGGVDEFSWKGAHDTICEAIHASAAMHSVTLFEGQVVSGIFQRYVDLANAVYNERGMVTHVVFVMPGEDECLRRVSKRNGKSIDDPRLVKSVREKYRAVENCYRKMMDIRDTGAAYIKPEYFETTDAAQEYVLDLVNKGVSNA